MPAFRLPQTLAEYGLATGDDPGWVQYGGFTEGGLCKTFHHPTRPYSSIIVVCGTMARADISEVLGK